jgi:hypothetical protein
MRVTNLKPLSLVGDSIPPAVDQNAHNRFPAENTKNKNETDWIVATNSNLLVNPTFYFVIFDDQYDDYFLSQYFNIVLSSSATTFTTSSMTVDSLATLPLSSVPTSIPTITTRPSTTNSTLSFYPVNYTTAILNRTTATGVASPSLRTDGTYPTSTAETTIPFSGLPPIAGIGIGTATVAALCIAFFAVYWYKRYRKLQAESRLPPCPLKVAEPRMHQNGGCLILIGPQEAPTAGTSIAEVHGDGMAPTQELDGSQIER